MTESPLPCLSDPRYVGDPIDVVSGANTDVITDLRQRGPIPFQWTRYYNSARSRTLCALGWGHSHHFDRRLIRDLEGVRYQDPLGNAVGFSDIDIGLWEAVGGLVLTRTAADQYYLEQEGQPSEEFWFSPGTNVAPVRWLRQGEHVIVLKYAEDGSLREIIDSHGRTIRVFSDTAGRVTRLVLADPKGGPGGTTLLAYEYDPAGNLVRATDRYDTTLTFAYDAANRMTRRTDRRGYSFHFEHDDQGRCFHSRGDDGLLEVFLDFHPDAGVTFVRRGDGGQWIYSYNEAGTVTKITDPYGNATQFILDERGRPVKEIDPKGNVTELHYDWRGRHDYRTDPNGHVLPPRSVDPDPPDPLAYRLPETALQWDFGRLVGAKHIRPPRRDDPVLAQFPAPVVNTVLGQTATYDASAIDVAMLTRIGGPEGGTLVTTDFGYPVEHVTPRFTERWKYDANGKPIEHQDRDGSVFRWTYKSWNAESQLIDPLGNAVSLDYTSQRLVSRVTDPRGTVTEYRYDLRDLLVEVREDGKLGESYRRDGAGNIIEKIDVSGRRLVSWEVGPGNVDKVRVLGSGERHVFEHNASGRITQAQTPAGTATFAYDDDGIQLEDRRDGKGVVHEVELRQLVGTTYFDKFKVGYETLDNGDLVVRDPTGAEHRFQRSTNGLIVKHLANGSRELCQFDADGRCRRKALLGNGRRDPLWMRGYVYSAAGYLVAVADTQQGTTKYRYDAAHRLVEESLPGGSVRRFAHDSAGNLVSQPGLTEVTLGEGNRLKGANGEAFTYNGRGHLSQRQGPSGAVRYAYDDLDMLVRCEINGEEWTASYDGLGRRTRKTWQGKTTTYYWDDFRLAAEVRHDGSCRLYVYADLTALAPFLFIEYASLDAPPESGTRYYVFTNQVGAPLRVEDDRGETVWAARLDPYGKAQVDPASTVKMPLRFPGHYYDEETDLHYNRFRYYSPELGRYLQSDPVGQIGGINVYAYPRQPLIGVDIDGLGGGAGKGKGAPKVGPPCLKPIDKETLKDKDKLEAAMKQKAEEMLAKMEEARNRKPTPQHWIELPGKPPQRIYTSETGRGPCLSLVVDKRTGQVYYGQNIGTTPREPLQQPLQSRTNERLAVATKGDIRNDGTPGSHSEVQALDKAMKDGAKPQDTAIYNTNTNGDIGQPPPKPPKTTPDAKPMSCCPNCSHITGARNPGPTGGPDGQGGAQPLTDTRDPYENGRYRGSGGGSGGGGGDGGGGGT
jgi:RHS repeat-associated protein